MIGDFLRKKSTGLLNKVGEKLSFIPVSANIFSSVAIIWAAGFSILIILDQKIPAFIFFLLTVIWDGIDGAFAKKRNDVTKFGYYVEGIIDKLAEIILLLGIFLIGYQLESFLLVSLTVMNSFAKPRAAMVVYIGEFDWPAVGERVERLIILSIGVLTYVIGLNNINISSTNFDILQIILILDCILVSIGLVQRIIFAKKLIADGGIKNTSYTDRLKK